MPVTINSVTWWYFELIFFVLIVDTKLEPSLILAVLTTSMSVQSNFIFYDHRSRWTTYQKIFRNQEFFRAQSDMETNYASPEDKMMTVWRLGPKCTGDPLTKTTNLVVEDLTSESLPQSVSMAGTIDWSECVLVADRVFRVLQCPQYNATSNFIFECVDQLDRASAAPRCS